MVLTIIKNKRGRFDGLDTKDKKAAAAALSLVLDRCDGALGSPVDGTDVCRGWPLHHSGLVGNSTRMVSEECLHLERR